MAPKRTRSPLQDKPLRNPGQSLDEEILNLGDKIGAYLFFTMGYLLIAFTAWVVRFASKPLDPVFFTIIAVALILLSTVRIVQIRRKMKLLKLARDGEKVVGQGLEELRQMGCAVFHDIQEKKFNIDHAVISSRGVFVIETKTFSKPTRGEATIFYDGKKILVNGHIPDRDPLRQVEANTNWIKETLKKTTGKVFPVKGVVVFPGWYVDSKMARGSSIWVLNPKALASFICNEPATIQDSDVHMIAFHLSRYISMS